MSSTHDDEHQPPILTATADEATQSSTATDAAGSTSHADTQHEQSHPSQPQTRDDDDDDEQTEQSQHVEPDSSAARVTDALQDLTVEDKTPHGQDEETTEAPPALTAAPEVSDAERPEDVTDTAAIEEQSQEARSDKAGQEGTQAEGLAVSENVTNSQQETGDEAATADTASTGADAHEGEIAAVEQAETPAAPRDDSAVAENTAEAQADGPAEGSSPAAPAPVTTAKDAPTTAEQDQAHGRTALADPASVAAVAQAFGRAGVSSSENSRPSSRTGVALSQKSLPSFPGAADASTSTDKSVPSAAPGEGSGPAASGSNSAAESNLLSPNPGAAAADPSGGERRASASSASSGIKIGKGPPPTTQASEELPFDFNRFLEQMKHRSATPVGEYVRSFIKGFAKKPYRTNDQIKLIFDFLAFISERMKECEVWASLTDAEFENAREAMEKLVMNRLYPYTFTPAVQKEGRWNVQTDDLERDRIFKQRIGLFGWLKEEHLDIPVAEHSRGFIEFSIQELLKINHYKAPRDKLICILNCCKVIFGMIRHLSTEENADTFIPVLIFVVLKANPDNLISNVEYISRFRNPERLSSESGYYLSSLMGAIAFIETMDYTSLSNITQEEFERNVEQAVQSIPEPESPAFRGGPTDTPPRQPSSMLSAPNHQRTPSSTSVTAPSMPGEESAKALPLTPMAASLADDTRAFFQRTGEAARAGLGRPMGALGRLINEGIEGIRTPSGAESGSSTGRTNTPNPTGEGAQGMTPSRSRFFGGLFGAVDPESQDAQLAAHLRSPLAGAGSGSSSGARRPIALDEEPQTPSTAEMSQDGFLPYNAGQPGEAPNAPPRLRPQMPQRGYSIDDGMYDDYDAAVGGRRNLLATSTASAGGGGGGGGGRGAGDAAADYYDDDDDDDQDTPNAAAVERMRRRRQMQRDFGGGEGYVPAFLSSSSQQQAGGGRGGGQQQPGTPSRTAAGREERVLTRGPLHGTGAAGEETEAALHASLLDQQAAAEEEAQQSAGVETLRSIFPGFDAGVIALVLQGCEGDVELAIDRLLEMQ